MVSYITKKTIEELRDAYPNELSAEVRSLPEALSQINTATRRKFIVIIDEWDVLIRDEADNEKVQEQYIDFLRGMFEGTEQTKYIQLAYLTGILPIKKMKTQSVLNNFDEYTMLDANVMAPYVGFTEKEVSDLCKKYGRDFTEAKSWYAGYLLEDHRIYNPYTIVKLMLRGTYKYKGYWTETGSYESVLSLINKDFDGLKASIIKMLSGTSAEINICSFQNDVINITNKDDVLTYLIHLGYLGYDQKTKSTFVPNEEIRQELMDIVESTKW